MQECILLIINGREIMILVNIAGLSYSVGHASRPQKDEVQTEVLIDDTKISSSNEDDQKAIDQEYGSATNARGLIKRNRPKKVESTDWMATQLTRRFGLAGGLAWLGILTFGVVSEQVKTRFEVATEEAGKRTLDENSQTEILTPEGLRYKDITIGGGPSPQKGFLIVLHFKAYANGAPELLVALSLLSDTLILSS